MRAYLHALSDVHTPEPWLSVQSGPRAESFSVVPATSARWAQRTAPSPVTAKTAQRGGLSVDLGRRALRSTCSRGTLSTKLHQPAISMPYEGLMGPDDRRKAAGQLALPVEGQATTQPNARNRSGRPSIRATTSPEPVARAASPPQLPTGPRPPIPTRGTAKLRVQSRCWPLSTGDHST
jgi:hypothetical protein